MNLSDLSKKQLYRLYRKLYESLPYGGHFGWDWRTLHLTHPSKYHALRSVAYAHDKAAA